MTTNFCVVGSPIEHSLSPILHKAAYLSLGLDFEYEKHEVHSGELANFLNQRSFTGLSVTMPLKSEAFALSGSCDSYSQLTGAANTLLRRGDSWHAVNTDVAGLMSVLSFLPNPETISVIGSGATSFSALVAISKLFPSASLFLMARSQPQQSKLREFGERLGLQVITNEMETERVVSSELVMSLVPQGAYQEFWKEVAVLDGRPKGWLFDVSYNPWPTEAASAWGIERTISGLEMLIWQAIDQVGLFIEASGGHPDFDRQKLYAVMKQAVSSK